MSKHFVNKELQSVSEKCTNTIIIIHYHFWIIVITQEIDYSFKVQMSL